MLIVTVWAIIRQFRRSPEPGLTELLTDPIVQMLMAADGIDPEAAATELRRMAQTLARRRE